MRHSFDEIVTTREALRRAIPEPGPRPANKTIDHIDDICRRFIAASPFVVIASRGADGRLDLSPKGDPAGFVAVLDEKTLVVPDRPGNNRADTFENLLVDPEVALIFLIPGNGDTLRVGGKGRIVRDARLQKRLAVKGRQPNLLLVVDVEEAFMHCAKCVTRSGLWQPQRWPDRSDVPSLAEAMVAHAELDASVNEMQTIIEDSYTNRMY